VEAGTLAALEQRLGHCFHDPSLVARALTHASYANEHVPTEHQESLAFLGDAALALVVAERLIADDPVAPVGVLTPRRADIVSGANLARWGAAIGLGPMLRLGRGEAQMGGRARESILATTFEAVIGVLYLEAGLPAVRAAVARLAGQDGEARVVG
jgi:ribonuclease-3